MTFPGWVKPVIALAAVVCLSSAAVAQDARLASRLDPRTAAAVARIVDSARARSLPTEPLVQKALQGAAKRAPAERVLGAVQELAGELAIARSSLGSRSSEAELVAGSSALHAGIAPASLARLRAARGNQPVTIAIATLTDLVARGVPVESAVSAILALADRGARDADLVAFGGQVGRDIAAGAPPGVAARARAGATGASGARPATVPVRPGNATPQGRRPTGQEPRGRP